jgi:hypothetical protein
MAIEIFNDGGCIRILSNNNTLLISKGQIKTIDTIRTDTVRIDIGEGPLKNIYIKNAEVITPQTFANPEDLRDAISAMLQSNISGVATEFNQLEEISQLNQILAVLLDIKTLVSKLQGGRGNPLMIDESTPGTVYYGYAVAGADTAAAIWAVLRAVRRRDIMVYSWADGDELFDNIWDDRLTLNYLPL